MRQRWRPYVPVAKRRQQARRELEKRRKKGQIASPVEVEGRKIARTFWGQAWCENLERYSDYANRLPRGRTYVRNGSVIDLQIATGRVTACVSGSSLYTVEIAVAPFSAEHWRALRKDCAGAIDSLVELLQGRLSEGVMARICRRKTGLFPAPAEITLRCSCPDWADMCKHVAAALYGVGARLDEQPELLFRLRDLDETELLAEVAGELPLTSQPLAGDRILESDDLGELFGLDLAEEGEVPTPRPQEPDQEPLPPEEAAALLAALRSGEARAAQLEAEGSEGEGYWMLAILEEWLVDTRRTLGMG